MWFNKEAEAKKKLHMKRMDNTHDYHLKSLTTGFRVSFRNFCESSTHLIGFRLLLIGKLPRKRSRRPGPMASTEC